MVITCKKRLRHKLLLTTGQLVMVNGDWLINFVRSFIQTSAINLSGDFHENLADGFCYGLHAHLGNQLRALGKLVARTELRHSIKPSQCNLRLDSGMTGSCLRPPATSLRINALGVGKASKADPRRRKPSSVPSEKVKPAL